HELIDTDHIDLGLLHEGRNGRSTRVGRGDRIGQMLPDAIAPDREVPRAPPNERHDPRRVEADLGARLGLRAPVLGLAVVWGQRVPYQAVRGDLVAVQHVHVAAIEAPARYELLRGVARQVWDDYGPAVQSRPFE